MTALHTLGILLIRFMKSAPSVVFQPFYRGSQRCWALVGCFAFTLRSNSSQTISPGFRWRPAHLTQHSISLLGQMDTTRPGGVFGVIGQLKGCNNIKNSWPNIITIKSPQYDIYHVVAFLKSWLEKCPGQEGSTVDEQDTSIKITINVPSNLVYLRLLVLRSNRSSLFACHC